MDELIAAYDSILVLWQDRAGLSPDAPHDPFSEDELYDTLRALLLHDRNAVFRIIEDARYEEVASASTLFGYQSLRLSLALRDVDLSEELLDRRQHLGLGHWLDAFMRSRCALLKGDVQAAHQYFADCLRHAEQYDALDRLDFELKLAMELSPIQMVFLGHTPHQTPALPALTDLIQDAPQGTEHG